MIHKQSPLPCAKLGFSAFLPSPAHPRRILVSAPQFQRAPSSSQRCHASPLQC